MFSYRNASVAATVVATVVFIVYAFIPFIANILFGIEGNEESNFVLRRSGILLFGVGVITWMSRNELPSVARNAIARGIAVALLGVAISAMYESYRGFPGPTIWLFTTIEAFFGGVFLYYSREKPKDDSISQ